MEISTKSQAENGADNTTIMTPLRVKQAIKANGGGGGGTSDYDQLQNRPQINSVTLTGNKTSSGLGLQDTLISGTNIKTINNQSLLGSGNITVGGGTSTDVQVNGTSITSGGVANILTQGTYSSSNKIATMADLPTIPTVPTKTSDLTNDGDGTHPFLLNGSPSYIDTISTYGGGSAYARNLAYTWDNGVTSESHIIANYEDIPTKVSDLQNDSGFLTTETDPVFSASAAAGITSSDITNWNAAEANVQSDWNQSDATADDYIKNKPTIPTVNDATLTIQQEGVTLDTFTANSATNKTVNIIETDPIFLDSAASAITEDDIEEWSGKQDALVSGTNIKTINNASILGPGNLIIGEGGVMATDVEINGNSITSDGTANIAAEGQYDETTNKLVTQSAVSTAISNALLDLDYISYANESFTNPILGTTSTVGVVTIQKPNNPMRVKISDNVTSIRLNNNDIVYIGMDDKGKTRIYSNNVTAFQSIRIGGFAWNVLSDGSVTFGGDE